MLTNILHGLVGALVIHKSSGILAGVLEYPKSTHSLVSLWICRFFESGYCQHQEADVVPSP